MSKKVFIVSAAIATILILFSVFSCGNSTPKEGQATENTSTSVASTATKPLNLAIMADLSDRIVKENDHMTQAEKDQHIINGLAERFIDKQKKDGFQKSNDVFQVVFYPSPAGGEALANNLSLDLSSIQGPKKKPLLEFQNNHASHIKELYDSALEGKDFCGSDIWGFFAKDKVKDLCKDGYRNILVILSDGYLYHERNKIVDGKKFSYILPKTLAIKDSGLIPCEISNPNMEVYFVECNPNPQTDFPKMKAILEKWFQDMGIEKIDIQDTDIPANTLKHLNNNIF